MIHVVAAQFSKAEADDIFAQQDPVCVNRGYWKMPHNAQSVVHVGTPEDFPPELLVKDGWIKVTEGMHDLEECSAKFKCPQHQPRHSHTEEDCANPGSCHAYPVEESGEDSP